MIQFRARHGARYFFLPSSLRANFRNFCSKSYLTERVHFSGNGREREREGLTDSCSEERRKKELLELSSIARYVEKETVWRSG